MKLGIKVGLKGDSIADIKVARPDFCEVWYHSGKAADYHDLLYNIKQLDCKIGLHFWGVLDTSGTLANLAYPDKQILAASRLLVQQTIDIAAKYDSWYVNVHPGGAVLSTVNFEKEQFGTYGTRVSLNLCQQALVESVSELGTYAGKRNVMLFVESVPQFAVGHPWYGALGRLKPIDLGEIPLTHMYKLYDLDNVFFTNDLGHTSANLVGSRAQIKDFLFTQTQKLAPRTKLIHTGYLIPPYNGTDYHGCLYYDEFKTAAALPNESEMKELLKLFVKREDVGALVEPETDHVRNFGYLKNLIENIS